MHESRLSSHGAPLIDPHSDFSPARINSSDETSFNPIPASRPGSSPWPTTGPISGLANPARRLHDSRRTPGRPRPRHRRIPTPARLRAAPTRAFMPLPRSQASTCGPRSPPENLLRALNRTFPASIRITEAISTCDGLPCPAFRCRQDLRVPHFARRLARPSWRAMSTSAPGRWRRGTSKASLASLSANTTSSALPPPIPT